MLTLHILLVILALVCFFAAAFDVKPPRISLVPLGLFLWLLSTVLAR